jgi:hypothetical protein
MAKIPTRKPKFTKIDIETLIERVDPGALNAPEVEYEFSNGRKFKTRKDYP